MFFVPFAIFYFVVFFVPFVMFYFVPIVVFFCPVCVFLSRMHFLFCPYNRLVILSRGVFFLSQHPNHGPLSCLHSWEQRGCPESPFQLLRAPGS